MYRSEIEKYIPINEQEIKDKEIILRSDKIFDNILTRDNEIVHLTSSAFIMNKDLTKVLLVYHNIYDSWSWTGGHQDGERDLLKVAIKEAKEETGLNKLEIYRDQIATIDVLAVKSHYKKGKYVAPHLHLSVGYILVADEKDKLKIKEDENSQVKWIEMDKLMEYTEKEKHMQYIYNKIIKRLK